MTTTAIIKIDKDLKMKVQKLAKKSGLNFSSVTKALLSQYVRTGRLNITNEARRNIDFSKYVGVIDEKKLNKAKDEKVQRIMRKSYEDIN